MYKKLQVVPIKNVLSTYRSINITIKLITQSLKSVRKVFV